MRDDTLANGGVYGACRQWYNIPMPAFLASISQYINNINWAHPSWDLILVMFFLVGSLIYGMSMGRDRIVIVLVAIYIAIAIVNYAPYISNFVTEVKIGNTFAFQVTMFVGMFAVLFFLLSQSALLKHLGGQAERGGTISAMIFSVLQTGLLISVILSYLPSEAVNVFSPQIQRLFVADIAKFAWVVAPIVVMAMTRGNDFQDRNRN